MMRTRSDCIALDAADPLAALRDCFALPEGIVYLDGNSLGALPKTTAARLESVVRTEWGNGLIGS
ncbi:MAG: kynureninase, partial [Caldimonas sp.]